MTKQGIKKIVDVVIMFLTALGGYLGASAANLQCLLLGMRLSTCENPRYVLSPHTGEMIRVACNTCNSCRNFRAKRWIQRLDDECKQHKFTYMVNLTYDDDSLPKLMFCEDDPDYVEFVNRSADRIPRG